MDILLHIDHVRRTLAFEAETKEHISGPDGKDYPLLKINARAQGDDFEISQQILERDSVPVRRTMLETIVPQRGFRRAIQDFQPLLNSPLRDWAQMTQAISDHYRDLQEDDWSDLTTTAIKAIPSRS